MSTTTATAALDLTCPTCHGTARYKRYSAMGNSMVRCPMCKGRKVITAAQWLRAFRAEPRTITRAQAIVSCAFAMGIDPRTGGDAYGSYVGNYEIASNGVAGLIVDMEECGITDVMERFLTRWNGFAIEGHRRELAQMLPEVRAARAIVRAAKRAA